MIWTTNVPTVGDSWYFWRSGPEMTRWIVRYVAKWPAGGLAVKDIARAAHSDGMMTPEQLGGEWQGPLSPVENEPPP